MKMLFPILMLSALAIQAQDPSEPGPRPVSNTTYRFNNVQMPTIAFPVDIWATVWHPDDLTAGPYPLLVFLHGNHGICRLPGTKQDVGTTLTPPLCPAGFEQTPNHLGYDYIAARLAGYGYIVVSINANAINLRANGNPERGRLVQEHLRYWALWNSPEGGFPFEKRFSGKVNLRAIGLMGHSRGGEGVRAAYNFNRQEGSPFGIRAVQEIGPVDFGRSTSTANAPTTGNPIFNADGVAWNVILPACDDDVFDNQGMRVYDRTRVVREPIPQPKSQIYVYGANHNYYNSEWPPLDPGFQCIDFPILVNRPPVEQIGMVYVMGFFRTYIGGENFRSLFTGDQRPPESVGVPIAQSYTEGPGELTVIDDFSSRRSPDENTAGGVNTTTNLKVRTCSGDDCNDPPPAAWLHDSSVFSGRVSWPLEGTATPMLTMRVATGENTLDFTKSEILAFRVAAEFDPRNPVLPTSQNFSVRLIDSTGVPSNSVDVGALRSIPYPTGYAVRRSVLRTMRIPVNSFRGIDLTRIRGVQFVFDKNKEGAVFLTDVHLSPR